MSFPCQVAWTGPHRAFLPFLDAQLKNDTQRIDAIWDNYPEENNIKALTDKRRGNGSRTRIGNGSTKIPKHKWNSGFLKNENKKELFSFISTQISKNDMGGKLLLSTRFETVLSSRPCDVTTLQPCNHSEADTRILLHLAHAAEHGHTKTYVRTVDSDGVVLAVRCLEYIGLSELWVSFGTGKKLSWHSNTYHPLQYRSIKVLGTAPLPQSNRMWHNFTVSWMW